MLITLFLFAYICLSAETLQQRQATVELKAKFGSDTSVEFLGEKNVVRSIRWVNPSRNVVDMTSAKLEGDRLITEFEPYTHIGLAQVEIIPDGMQDFESKIFEIGYYQKRFDNIKFETTPTIGFTFYNNGLSVYSSNFIYDFALPEKPYISKQQVETIAQLENKVEERSSEQINKITGKLYMEKITPIIELLVCNIGLPEDKHILGLCWRIEYEGGDRIYVDAKTGEIIHRGNYAAK